MKIAASALVAGLALGLAAAQQPPPACTGLAVTSTLPKSTRPGAMTTYTLKITNSGSAAVSGLSLIAHLPDFSEYMSLKPFPKLASGPTNPFIDGQALNWTGLSIPAGKTQTLKLAVAISSCAANTVQFNANITGANGCVAMAPRAQTTIKRSHKDKPCAPTPAPTPRVGLTCETPAGMTSGSVPIYACAPQYYMDWMGQYSGGSQVADYLACANYCTTLNAPAFAFLTAKSGGGSNCSCYKPEVQFYTSSGDDWAVYCYKPDRPLAYFIGSVQNPGFIDYASGDYTCLDTSA